MHHSFAILVLSCDKYSDVWPAFFKCFKENFPYGELPVYLGSNTIRCTEPGVKTLLSGTDPDWSTSFKQILKQIPQTKIFVILEDLFLSSSISEGKLSSLFNFMIEKEATFIRYWANPATPDYPTDNPLIGESARGAPYRCTVCGIWDKEYLLKLLIEGENPWNFEILGSYRTSYSDGFYALISPLCEYQNMIEKGKWIPSSVDWANSQKLPIVLETRPILKGKNQVISALQRGIFRVVTRIPWQYRVTLMNKLRRLLISY